MVENDLSRNKKRAKDQNPATDFPLVVKDKKFKKNEEVLACSAFS